MSDVVLFARSLREIEFYLKLTRCSHCRRAELNVSPLPASNDASASREFIATCKSCPEPETFLFRISGAPSDRSRMIDVAQWLTLYGLTIEASHQERQKTLSRRLAIEAATCLNEALRFYDDENDLPPADGFFTEDSRARFREHPELFSRQRLLNLRAQLPTPSRFDTGTA